MSPDPMTLHLEAFDLLASMVAVVRPSGECLFANAKLEDTMGVSRKTLLRGNLLEWMVEPGPLRSTLAATAANVVATGRFEGQLRRLALGSAEPLPVQVLVAQTDRFDRLIVELIEIEQQTRIDREERSIGLAQANKELLRNLAHEIKNPLGGIRGAAQLLAMEIPSPELSEYTNVIIHEVCERVRSVVLAEYPRGLSIVRDYDTSIPEFRGDREQLIQAVLNIVHNAAQILSERQVAGDARIELRTRIARQVTVGKQRFRLALELHVQDNGPGVPEDIRDHIFHPLITGREGGSGLGLTLAQTFVQQHQGTITCDSAPGRTVFTIMIPLP